MVQFGVESQGFLAGGMGVHDVAGVAVALGQHKQGQQLVCRQLFGGCAQQPARDLRHVVLQDVLVTMGHMALGACLIHSDLPGGGPVNHFDCCHKAVAAFNPALCVTRSEFGIHASTTH